MEGSLTPELDRALQKFADDLAQLQQVCKAKRIELFVIAYGSDAQLGNDELLWPQKWLEQFCIKRGIYFLDLLPAFKNHKKDDVLIDEGHPSEFGNKLLAAYIYDFLADKPLLNDN